MRRRLMAVTAVLALLAVAASAALFGLGRTGVLLAVALGVLLLLGILDRRSLQQALRGAPRREELTLRLVPSARHQDRSPVPLATLARGLEQARLGAVHTSGARLEVRSPDGHRFRLSPEAPEAVTWTRATAASTSDELALLSVDALAPWLGPVTLQVEGMEFLVDGTTPRWELQRLLHDRRMEALARAERAAPRDRPFLH